MNAETFLRLLEEHIADIRQSLETNPWRAFVHALVQISSDIVPRRDVLETWADKVRDLLMGYSYSRGLLQGLRFQADLPLRSAPMAAPCPEDSVGPAARTALRRTDENTLVMRIKAVVQKAQVML